MSEIPAWYKSTNWELTYYDEVEEQLEAQADRVAAVVAGTEPKAWPISGLNGTEWPREAIFPLSKEHVGKTEVRFE